jgi:hypothetical protein
MTVDSEEYISASSCRSILSGCGNTRTHVVRFENDGRFRGKYISASSPRHLAHPSFRERACGSFETCDGETALATSAKHFTGSVLDHRRARRMGAPQALGGRAHLRRPRARAARSRGAPQSGAARRSRLIAWSLGPGRGQERLPSYLAVWLLLLSLFLSACRPLVAAGIVYAYISSSGTGASLVLLLDADATGDADADCQPRQRHRCVSGLVA